MKSEFPSAVPEIPVADMAKALTYYEEILGFTVDGAAMEAESLASRKDAAGSFSRITRSESIFTMKRRS